MMEYNFHILRKINLYSIQDERLFWALLVTCTCEPRKPVLWNLTSVIARK